MCVYIYIYVDITCVYISKKEVNTINGSGQ